MTEELSRRLIFNLFSRIEEERIEVVENGRRYGFGPPDAELRAVVTVHEPGVWRQLVRGSTGLAETYKDGHWDADDLVALIRIAARNFRAVDKVRHRWRVFLRLGQEIAAVVPRNDPEGSRANIAAHYDLGNTLFSLFLDESMMYSCAYFEWPEATLAEAQRAKLDRICRALALGPDDHLLEIGTGWGAMAVHAAKSYGCRVTTTTISREQQSLACDRVRAAGVEDRIEVLLEDYRELTGSYDKLVSIEMIEAVGWQYFSTYFERCSRLLKDDGLMLLQAITIDDRAYHGEKASKSFINTQIFPGGCLPSLGIIHKHLSRDTDMVTVGLEDITPHYGETLARWREGFAAHAGKAERLGYDRSFQRMWDLYLSYVEAGFRERRIGSVQMLLAKPQWRDELPGSGVGSASGSGDAAGDMTST